MGAWVLNEPQAGFLNVYGIWMTEGGDEAGGWLLRVSRVCLNVRARELVTKRVVPVGKVGGRAAFPEQSFLGRCWMKMVTREFK